MDWILNLELTEAQTRSLVAGMREMSAVDGHVDEQEQELIDMLVADMDKDECLLDLAVFTTLEEKVAFLRLVTFVAIVDTTVNDEEWALLQSYITALNVSETPQSLVDFVGEVFLNEVFADAEREVWLPILSKDLRLSDSTIERLQADT